MTRTLSAICSLLLPLTLSSAWAADISALHTKNADLILINGAVFVEAPLSEKRQHSVPIFSQAIAVRNGEILSVGTTANVMKNRGENTRVVDLKGRGVIPGFHDGYLNWLEGGLKLLPDEDDRSTQESHRKALLKAQEVLSAAGITSVSGPSGPHEITVLRELALESKLYIRFELWGDLEKSQEFNKLKESSQASLPQDFVRFGGVYGVLDGDLRDRTAALLAPYSDAPDTQGIPRYSQENLNAMVLAANHMGQSVILKASGDRAVNMAITAFGTARKTLFNGRLRNRIVGADLIAPQVRGRLGDLGITVVAEPDVLLPQPGEANAHEWVTAKLGRERSQHAYPWKTLVNMETRLAFGSLWPGRELNPLASIYAAITRPGLKNVNESLNIYDALRAFTMAPAYATKEEHVKGGLREGKFADMVVLSRNPFTLRAQDLRTVQVDMTIAAGHVAYERPESATNMDQAPRRPASKIKRRR